jgi:uncharacterized protein (TIGR02145 family)
MKFKYLLILFLFLYNLTIGQVPGSPRILNKNDLPQTYTLNYTISNDLNSAIVSAITLNNGQSAVTTSGIIMGSVYPLTLSTVGATITSDGNISGGTYSNTFTGLSQTNNIYFVAYATTNIGTSYGSPLIVPQQTVYNAATGETWMTYNVGASAIPTSITDTAGYGFLFQWGRRPDGHQYVRPTPSGTTTTIATSSTPNNGGLYIIGNSGSDYYNWLSARNNALWGVSGTAPTGGVNGNNNPCPTGFRLPTNSEFDTEINSWTTTNGAGAFNSSLKLTYCGYRDGLDLGKLKDVGAKGWYWTRDTPGNGTYYYKAILSTSVDNNRTAAAGLAMAVRCIKH